MKWFSFVFCGLLTSFLSTDAAVYPARIDISGVPSVKLNFTKQDEIRIDYGEY